LPHSRLRAFDYQKLLASLGGDEVGASLPDMCAKPLRLLLADLGEHSSLNAFGTFLALEELRRLTATAMQLWQAVPEFGTVALDRPAIVIGGLPRTGTSFVQELLALDSESRVVRHWEAVDPLSAVSRNASLMAQAQQFARDRLAIFHRLSPEFDDIHPMQADSPEECNALLQHSFASIQFPILFSVPQYSAWLLDADLGPHYALHAVVLNSLPWPERGCRWVLKSPMHILCYPELDALLPKGSQIVEIHRDPLTIITSWCSLVSAARRVFTGSRKLPEDFANEWSEFWNAALRRRSSEASSPATTRRIRIEYDDLVGDPKACVAQIYAACQIEMSARFEQRMNSWLSSRDRVSSHSYDSSRLRDLHSVERFLESAASI
jgi:sulfotransferase family protein